MSTMVPVPITMLSHQSCLAQFRKVVPLNSIVGSSAGFTANKAYYIPIYIPDTVTAYKACYASSSASGNLDIGLYTSSGTRLVSTGSTAQSGTNVWQTIDFTDTTINAGTYYMAFATDTGASRFESVAATLVVQWSRLMAIYEEASAFPLPATATFATTTATTFPWFGITVTSTPSP